jgi:hypothetical protein
LILIFDRKGKNRIEIGLKDKDLNNKDRYLDRRIGKK